MNGEHRRGFLAWVAAGACLIAGVRCTRRPPLQTKSMEGASALAADPLAEKDKAAVIDDPGQEAEWVLEPASDATVVVRRRGRQVVTMRYVFWGEKWTWADATVENLKRAGGATTFELKVGSLGLEIHGKAAKTEKGELAIEYAINAKKALHKIVGGGFEYNLEVGEASFEDPRLIRDNRGFEWQPTPADKVAVTFDPGVATAFFEKGQKNTIRCFLVGEEVSPRAWSVTMKIRLPNGGVVLPSADERYGADDRHDWYPQTLAWDRWPIDVSFLNDGNRPAGIHGPVKAEGDKLVFEDGTPARFWGTNLEAYALFGGQKADIANQAKRIAALGYNLVRLHHHDSPWVKPNVFEIGPNTQSLNEQALDTLDWWVKCLEDEGVYIWLDLNVERQFQAGDGVEGLGELAKQNGTGKGFNYVDGRIEKLMQDFATRYLTRTNRYTGKAYTHDAAVMGVLVTNENDITQHFGNVMTPDKGNPIHQRMFEKAVKLVSQKLRLPFSSASKPYELGPAKLVLAELEHDFFRRSIDHLRGLGLKSPVAATSYWGDENAYCLPSLTAGDIIDVHAYGKAETLGVNPRQAPNFVAWIGAAQVAGKPISITEWNVEYPNRDRFVVPPYLAAVASLQGWDAPMLYGYLQAPVQEPEKPDPWSTWNDPAITALMPAAAVMFRQGHVREAQKTYRLDLSREAVFFENTNPQTSVAIRTLVEQSKLTIGLPDVPELDWDGARHKSADVIAVSDPGRDFLPAGQNFVVSDTGELKRDWSHGIETIDTAKSQGAMGWIGGRHIHLTDVDIDLRTRKATVMVTSLDGKPVASSKRLLFTAVAQVASSPDDKLPFLAEPIEGAITLRGAGRLRMVPLSPRANPPALGRGDTLEPIVATASGQALTFNLTRGVATHWFLLVP
jgi:hypothetical protein